MSRSGPGALDAVFEPPSRLRARFGWVCGMTADGPFVERALDRFSRQSTAQRMLAGRIYLGLLLDPSNPQIPPLSAPGALHLAARIQPLPFRLLHAKVALLGFDDEESKQWCVRLVVSTGNWTTQTLDRSLDLLWVVDLHSGHPSGPERRQTEADVKAAAAFLSRLRERFVTDALHIEEGPQARATSVNIAMLDAWIDSLSPGDVAPRFIHNEDEPLIDLLPQAALRVGGSTRRNYLVLGSGFYGTGGSPNALPDVPARIVRTLTAPEGGMLTLQPSVDVVVNPSACQGVATAAAAIAATKGWRVIAPRDPHGDTGGVRFLHAKFIFAANWSEGGRATSPWLYLGSGNLTEAGFLRKALPEGRAKVSSGNLEAGVVFAPEVVPWKEISRFLPFDPDAKDLSSVPQALTSGAEAPERPPCFVAPPFAFLLHDIEGTLRPSVTAPHATLLWPVGQRTNADEDGNYPCPSAPPPQVEVAWHTDGSELRAVVPIVDREGRIAGSVRGPLTFEALAEELGSFPDQPDVEATSVDTSDEELTNGNTPENGARADSVSPLRDVMLALELIAARQTRIHEPQWEAWVARLEQALVRMKDQPMVDAVQKLGVNPLSALRLPAFRPPFCEGPISPQDPLYEHALLRIERAWGVCNLSPLTNMEV